MNYSLVFTVKIGVECLRRKHMHFFDSLFFVSHSISVNLEEKLHDKTDDDPRTFIQHDK